MIQYKLPFALHLLPDLDGPILPRRCQKLTNGGIGPVETIYLAFMLSHEISVNSDDALVIAGGQLCTK